MEIDFSHLNLKALRAIKGIEQLKDTLNDIETEYQIKKDRQIKKVRLLNKKLTNAIKDLDEEVKLNNELYQELTQQKNRIKILDIDKTNLQYDLEEAKKKIEKLYDYKHRKRKAFKTWLFKRVKRRGGPVFFGEASGVEE